MTGDGVYQPLRFGELLRQHRVRLGLTQEQLAERAGLSRRGIADLERSARLAPYRYTVQRLADALGLSDRERVEFDDLSGRQTSQQSVDRQSSPPRRRPQLHVVVSDSVSQPRARPTHPRGNLPFARTSFVGREEARADVEQLLGSSRLVTLTGPGGVGKTRLAVEVATSVAAGYSDGVFIVDLSPLTHPNQVPSACANLFAIHEHPDREVSTSVTEWLRDRNLLLVLDNCEHVIEGCAELVDQLLRSCEHLQILVTSREILNIQGEWLFRVRPLTLPPLSNSTDVRSVLDSEAGRLFAERARSVALHFAVTDETANSVAHICQQLDGIPLAIELAAVELRTLSVAELADRIADRITPLASSDRAALPQHRSLRSLIGWSYDLLTPPEQTLFQRVTVFVGGWSLAAAEDVCSGDSLGREQVVELLRGLVDKSLVHRELLSDGTSRYLLLQTLQEFGFEHLLRGGSADEWRRRHAVYFALVILRRWGPVWWCEQTAQRLDELDRESHNFRSALAWLVDAGEAQLARQLAGSLTYFWMLRERVREGKTWLRRTLDLPSLSADGDAASAIALVGMGHIEMLVGDQSRALATTLEGLAAARSTGEAWLIAVALIASSWLTWIVHHDGVRARDQLDEGLALAERADLQPLAAFIRVHLAEMLCERRDFEGAARLMETNAALGHAPTFPHAWFGGLLLVRIRFGQGAYAQATQLLQETIAHERSNGSPLGLSLALTVLSWACLAQRDLVRARETASEALQLVRDNLGPGMGEGHLCRPLEALALVAAATGEAERALRLVSAGAALREAGGMQMTPNEQALVERGLIGARGALGPDASEAAWAVGQTLTPGAAVAEALAG